jgi:hypothetical protein
VLAGGSDPEAWIGRGAELMEEGPYHVPSSSMAEVAYASRMIGGTTASAIEQIDLLDWGGRSR